MKTKDRAYHVYPQKEEREHALNRSDASCECIPTVKEVYNSQDQYCGKIIIHNSLAAFVAKKKKGKKGRRKCKNSQD